MKPLAKPISPPIRRTTSIPTVVGSSNPKPNEAAGSTTIAPIAGAIPTVDSSERSKRPLMMISDSASTTSAYFVLREEISA